MSILAGSYERFLFGYAVQGAGNEVRAACMQPAAGLHACTSSATARHGPPLPAGWMLSANPDASTSPAVQLKRSFTHAAHKGVVKCIAAAGQFAATGGADDLIHLYDLKVGQHLLLRGYRAAAACRWSQAPLQLLRVGSPSVRRGCRACRRCRWPARLLRARAAHARFPYPPHCRSLSCSNPRHRPSPSTLHLSPPPKAFTLYPFPCRMTRTWAS